MLSLINVTRKILKGFTLAVIILLTGSSARAAGYPVPSSMSNPFVVIMVVIMLILALVIGLLANVLLGAAYVRAEKDKAGEEKKEDEKPVSSNTPSTAALVTGLLLLSSSLFAQDKGSDAAGSVTNLINGVSPTAFYMITGVIFLELIIVTALLYNLRLLLDLQRKKNAAVEYKPRVSWWDKLNKFKPVEQELAIDLGHDYDGIRELDNRLPPWWLYGFYCTILFACIYLWRYHVSHTAPLSGEEFQIAMQKAAVQREEYLKKAANNVDETNVKLLTADADLSSGKTIFQTTCFACHGKAGEGTVGPNLTDDYWLHGGSIQDIFKTIKYGWPEKGMKSWKDDYSPSQIAQLASYIKSLHGTNPPNAKAPQGTLYTEEPSGQPHTADSAAKNDVSIKREY